MNIEDIEKYILEGNCENQYRQALEHLIAEVKRLRKQLDRTNKQFNHLTDHWRDEQWDEWYSMWGDEE